MECILVDPVSICWLGLDQGRRLYIRSPSFIAFPAFFITLCYHTIYAAPWIIPPVAFYAFDVLMRMARYRIKDAWLTRVDGQMTIVNTDSLSSFFLFIDHSM